MGQPLTCVGVFCLPLSGAPKLPEDCGICGCWCGPGYGFTASAAAYRSYFLALFAVC